MPGLGDALSKAFEDSMNDLDALIEKAAREEGAAEEADEAAAGPAAEVAADPVGVSGGEKTQLFSQEDLAEAIEPAPGAPAPVPDEAAPPEHPPDEAPPGATPPRRVTASLEEVDRAARNALEATRILDDAFGAPSSPPAPVGEEAPAEAAVAAEAPVAAELPPPPAAPPDPSAVTSVTMAEPVAPFAQFAPSGIIRRKLRKPTAGETPAPPPVAPAAPAAPPPVREEPGAAVEASAVQEPVAPAPEPVEAREVAPAVEDVLAVCRRLTALERSSDYRIPLLADGIDGLVRMVKSGNVGSPAAVAICGAAPQVGTSTVAGAFALKLAEDGNARVLLVDGDLRAPSVARFAGKAGTGPDLKSVLAGEASLGEAVLYAPAENLAILPAYGWGERSQEKLKELAAALIPDNVEPFLDMCRRHFEYIVIDAGSTADWSGPAALAGAVGCAVLVVRAGRTTAKVAMTAKQELERAGSRLEGSVLNFA
jgi:Mrp family chromosome partitioning ATPase